MKPFVAILMGSKTDHSIMENCQKVLDQFGVSYEYLVSSAHRTPARTKEYIKNAEEKGAAVFICAAGMAAHLAGAVAAATTKPVLGVPMPGGGLDGVDALYSTVQMPAGMPVGTVAIGNAGAKNSAYLAVQILALNDSELAKKLLEDREAQAQKVEEDSKTIEVFI
ncbi:MAG: 5-(carboxyamino)imidazole ribonucleotide mutase [Campylobacterales bacterium]|nr:5-(carboxyamino)imidazole ribonucleotide mutase [Campylobacterales bacterium]